MARYALIREQDSVVVNVIEWDGDTEKWKPDAGQSAVLVPEGERVDLDDTYEGGAFVPKKTEEP